MKGGLEEEIKKIIEVVKNSEVIIIRYRGKLYNYIINPISTGLSAVSPEILNAISKIFKKIIDFNRVDYIFTFEAMGIHIATTLSINLNIPVTIARKRDYTGNMIPIYRGEGATPLFVHPEIKGSTVTIIDSIISTGYTIIGAINTLKKLNVNIRDIGVVIERVDKGGANLVKKETGHIIKSIVKISVGPDKVEIL